LDGLNRSFGLSRLSSLFGLLGLWRNRCSSLQRDSEMVNSYPPGLQSVKGWPSPPVRLNPSSEQFGLETCRRAHVESLTAERLKVEDSRRSPSTPPFGLPSAMSSGRMELRVEDSGQALLTLDGYAIFPAR